MKTIILLACLLAAAVAMPAGTYGPEYDNFNVAEILESERLVKNYANCFTDQGPCTKEGADIKQKIPEALRNTCANCSPKQRKLVREFCKGIKSKFPQIWESIAKVHDPKGEYKESFDKFLSSTD